MEIKDIIFDLDGTLIDSKGEILNTYRLVFSEISPDVYPQLEKLNYGLTLNDLLNSVYVTDEEKIADAKRLFMNIYDNSNYENTTLYSGVEDTLQQLKNDGFNLYIATNKREYPTKRILANKKIEHLFADIMANEMDPGITLTKRQMVAELKLRHSFLTGFMVGDSVTDIQAGIDEGLITVAISYGYESPEVLAALKPTWIADTFLNLRTFVVENQ